MTILPIIKHDIQTLTTPSEDWDFDNPPQDTLTFAKDLVETMYANKGIGLAAIQVGVPYRVFAMRGSPEDFVIFNPRIIVPSDEMVRLEEGCLSWEGLVLNIDRPKHIKVRFAGPSGEVFTQTYTGLTARIFLHEYEHTLGKLFFEHVKRYKLEQAIKKAKKTHGINYEGMGLLKYCK